MSVFPGGRGMGYLLLILEIAATGKLQTIVTMSEGRPSLTRSSDDASRKIENSDFI